MHYHVVRIDEEGEHVDPALTFDRQDEAEERAVAVAREIDGPGWSGKRYPGRSWRRQGLAGYIDRRVLEREGPRLELSVVRCDGPRPGAAARCCASPVRLPWGEGSRRPARAPPVAASGAGGVHRPPCPRAEGAAPRAVDRALRRARPGARARLLRVAARLAVVEGSLTPVARAAGEVMVMGARAAADAMFGGVE